MKVHPESEPRYVPLFGRTVPFDAARVFDANEDFFRDLAEHNPTLLCVHDLQGRFLWMNPAPAALLGYTVDELLGIPMRELIAPEFQAKFEKYLKRIANDGHAEGVLAVVSRSSERRIWEYHNTLRTEGVEFPMVRGTARDVTARSLEAQRPGRQVLNSTSDKEHFPQLQLFRAMVDQSSDALTIIEPETLRLLEVNDRACTQLGYSREELLSMTIYDIAPGLDEKRRSEVVEQIRESGSARFERVYRRKDGTTFPAEVTLRETHLGGQAYGLAVSRDITARKQSEAQLQESETRYRAVHEMSPAGIAWTDATGRFLKVNPRFCEIVGRTEYDLLQLDFQSITHPGDLEKTLEAKLQLASGGVRKSKLEKRYVRPDGSARWVEVDVVVMEPEGQNPTWHMALVYDITERKRAEQALRNSEQNYRNFVSQSSEGIFREDMDAPVPIDLPEDELVHHILHDSYMAECNDALARMYGLTSGEEFVGKRLTEMLPPEDPHNVELTREYIRSGFRVLERESHEVDIHGNPKVFLNSMIGTVENGMLVHTWGIQRDVTEKTKLDAARRKAEEALQEGQARERAKARELETVLDTVPVPVFIAHDIACCRITANRAGYQLLRMPPGANVSKTADPKERPTFRVLQNGIEVSDDQLPMQLAAVTGSAVYGVPITIAFENGVEVQTLFNAVPLLGADGTPTGVIGASIDVTESTRTEEALRQSEQRFRIALEGSPIKVFNQDLDLRYTWVYNAEESWTEKDYLSKTDEEIFEPDDAARMTAIKRHVLATGKGAREEISLNVFGAIYHCDLTVEPLRDAAGAVVGVNSACVDITHFREIAEELRLAKEKLAEEKLYLEKTMDAELGFGEIIGRSGALKEVMEKVAKVATSDATVLLLGETGTGKELVARAVHQMSNRKDASFIKMNCAAIPSGLLESELFGHEKGAFTGAVSKKLGRIELADHGTLFLDEIGEIPLELQPKLLRVLQDREFERLGGTQTIKVNFRLLAATNRDLVASVSQRQFRSDLYYRLNVFPIRIPPLRERREDIPLLIEHFVQKYANRMNKSITSIPAKTMEALVQWTWPGNIRELENFVERSVILTPGMVLQSPLVELHGGPLDPKKETLRDMERDRIIRALRECKGQLGGPNGAAARLGLKRTTLQSKLTQFGINPGGFRV
jgi:PAS domain S-box-containing protein